MAIHDQLWKDALRDPELIRNAAFVDGEWCHALDGSSLEVIDPSTGGVLGTVPGLGEIETRHAIEAASRAWGAWKRTTAKDRAVVLRRWFDLIMQHQSDLATILTLEQGKPLHEAKAEIAYAASFIEWFAEEGKRVSGETPASPFPDRRLVILKEPVGVCAAITPWNFPAAMITRKVGPALAAGCTMVVKPSELTPFSALALAVLAERAGVPRGVLNIITGDAKMIGNELTGNPIVRKLSFTGSTQVGRLLLAQCAPTIKKVTLELGGNAPFIVFDDADINAAVQGAIASKYRNTGQTCICTNRFYVHEKVYDQFADMMVSAVRNLKLGRGVDPNVSIGPLINEAAVQKVERHIADCVDRGGSILLGGNRSSLGSGFYEPTVLAGATHEMLLAKEETFGPVAPLFKFTSDEQVVQQANNTEYGLAAYFYSTNIGRVWRVAEALEYGMVGVNTGLISNEVSPFGGVKQSGIGREGSHFGIDDYLVIKSLCIGNI